MKVLLSILALFFATGGLSASAEAPSQDDQVVEAVIRATQPVNDPEVRTDLRFEAGLMLLERQVDPEAIAQLLPEMEGFPRGVLAARLAGASQATEDQREAWIRLALDQASALRDWRRERIFGAVTETLARAGEIQRAHIIVGQMRDLSEKATPTLVLAQAMIESGSAEAGETLAATVSGTFRPHIAWNDGLRDLHLARAYATLGDSAKSTHYLESAAEKSVTILNWKRAEYLLLVAAAAREIGQEALRCRVLEEFLTFVKATPQWYRVARLEEFVVESQGCVDASYGLDWSAEATALAADLEPLSQRGNLVLSLLRTSEISPEAVDRKVVTKRLLDQASALDLSRQRLIFALLSCLWLYEAGDLESAEATVDRLEMLGSVG